MAVTVIVDLPVDVFVSDGHEVLAAEFILGGSNEHLVAFDEVVEGDGSGFEAVRFARHEGVVGVHELAVFGAWEERGAEEDARAVVAIGEVGVNCWLDEGRWLARLSE